MVNITTIRRWLLYYYFLKLKVDNKEDMYRSCWMWFARTKARKSAVSVWFAFLHHFVLSFYFCQCWDFISVETRKSRRTHSYIVTTHYTLYSVHIDKVTGRLVAFRSMLSPSLFFSVITFTQRLHYSPICTRKHNNNR